MSEEHSPLEDCRWIVELCSRVFVSVICLLENRAYETVPVTLAQSA